MVIMWFKGQNIPRRLLGKVAKFSGFNRYEVVRYSKLARASKAPPPPPLTVWIGLNETSTHITPKFHILQGRGEITSNNHNKDWKSYRFSISCAAVLDFVTRNGCRYYCRAGHHVCKTIWQPWHVTKLNLNGDAKRLSFPYFVFIKYCSSLLPFKFEI